MNRTVAGFLLVALLLPVFSYADNIRLGVGLRTSVLSYNEDEIDDSRLFWGGHGRLMVTDFLGGEVSLQRREDNFGVGDGNIELETWPLQLSAVVYPLALLHVTPYFLAGTGWYFLTATVTGDLGLPYVTGEGSIDHTENAYHIGVGVEAFVGDRFSFGADVRKIFLTFDTELIDYEFDAYFVNIGATFYF